MLRETLAMNKSLLKHVLKCCLYKHLSKRTGPPWCPFHQRNASTFVPWDPLSWKIYRLNQNGSYQLEISARSTDLHQNLKYLMSSICEWVLFAIADLRMLPACHSKNLQQLHHTWSQRGIDSGPKLYHLGFLRSVQNEQIKAASLLLIDFCQPCLTFQR